MSAELPEGLARFTMLRLGADGAAWLAALPELVAGCAERWSLTVDGPPFANANVGYVLPVRDATGAAAILKLSVADAQTRAEASGLKFWDGRGAVTLLADDERDGTVAMLLERALPGTALSALADDREATALGADCLRALWRTLPDGHSFDTLASQSPRWAISCQTWWEQTGRPCPRRLLDEALQTLATLPSTTPELVLCHQDAHRGNFISSARGYLAIDAKPLAGERAFDCAALLREQRTGFERGDERRAPTLSLTPRRVIASRLAVLSDGLDAERVRAWAVAQALHLGLWALSVGLAQDGPRLLACA